VTFNWPPLWYSGHSSWLQVQRSVFHSRLYQIFWELVGLERGPLSLVSTIEELLGRKSSVSDLESRECGRRDPSRWPRSTLFPQKLALTSPTSCDRSVSIVRSRTQTTEFRLVFSLTWLKYVGFGLNARSIGHLLLTTIVIRINSMALSPIHTITVYSLSLLHTKSTVYPQFTKHALRPLGLLSL
jgi:hypothetical protein